VIKLYWKSDFKDKKKRHKTFNTKVNDDSVFFFSDSEKKEKINDEIAVLFKKTLNKMFKSEWVSNSEFFSYIIDQLQLFSDSLICMKHWWIRVKKRHLYFYYCEVIIMWIELRNSVRLSLTLYIFKLEVNLLFRKWMCKMKLYRNFD